MTNPLTIYHPTTNFLSFSVTGAACQRNCAHCGGHYLKGMLPTATPKRLFEACLEARKGGAVGALVSGGCDISGKIDFQPFLQVLEKIANFPDFKLNIHTGFLDEEGARVLANVPFDAVSMDIVGSKDTIRRVYGLEEDPGNYHHILDIFRKADHKVSPHICIGLDFGNILGEKAAIDIIAKNQDIVTKLIFIILIPSKGTEMEMVQGPETEEILEIVRYARERINRPIMVGCMRPRSPHLELLLAKAGINGLVNPLASTLRELRSRAGRGELELLEEDGCCCF